MNPQAWLKSLKMNCLFNRITLSCSSTRFELIIISSGGVDDWRDGSDGVREEVISCQPVRWRAWREVGVGGDLREIEFDINLMVVVLVLLRLRWGDNLMIIVGEIIKRAEFIWLLKQRETWSTTFDLERLLESHPSLSGTLPAINIYPGLNYSNAKSHLPSFESIPTTSSIHQKKHTSLPISRYHHGTLRL